MASNDEIYQILGYEVDGALDLRRKVEASCIKTANTISSGNDDGAPFSQNAGDHDQRVKWADLAYNGDSLIVEKTFRAVIGANADASQAGILGASDAAIDSNVDAVVDTLAANL